MNEQLKELDSALRRLKQAHAVEIVASEAATAAKRELEQAEVEVRTMMEAADLDKLTAYGLDVARVTRTVYNVDPAAWPKIYDRIRMTGEFDLLHKRISLPAVAARMKVGDLIPGVMEVQLPDLKVTVAKVQI